MFFSEKEKLMRDYKLDFYVKLAFCDQGSFLAKKFLLFNDKTILLLRELEIVNLTEFACR
jgi:hypothetical protein